MLPNKGSKEIGSPSQSDDANSGASVYFLSTKGCSVAGPYWTFSTCPQPFLSQTPHPTISHFFFPSFPSSSFTSSFLPSFNTKSLLCEKHFGEPEDEPRMVSAFKDIDDGLEETRNPQNSVCVCAFKRYKQNAKETWVIVHSQQVDLLENGKSEKCNIELFSCLP